MCGIAGIIRLDGSKVDRHELTALTKSVSHRGPDSEAVHLDHNIGLGHCRLSILDLSNAAAQPMQSQDKNITLTFNGEIYNFQEERELLTKKGYTFHSSGDTEVLLKLYEEYGPDCLSHLRGMFSFAVIDKKRNILFAARDRFGKKPFKYFYKGGVFAFASELKALRTLKECPKEIDEEAIHHFLTMMYMPSPLTGFQGIRKLPAAHSLTLDLLNGTLSEDRYWQLDVAPNTNLSVHEWKEHIHDSLKESVRLRMISDVPVGAFLSGGIDSACVVALMSELSPHPVKTYSVGFSHASMNELPQAKMIAEHFGTDHHPIVVEPDIIHLLPELVRTYEEPYADTSSIPTFLIARETRKGVTVALNGDGGDEAFAGYARYAILQFSESWAKWPGFIHLAALGGAKLFHLLRNDTLSYRALRFQHSIREPWFKRYLQYLSYFTEEEKTMIERKGFADFFPVTADWYVEKTAEPRMHARDTVRKAMLMDIDTYLPDDLMPKVDLATMAHGLEARSPFLDHRFQELAAQIPTDLLIKHRKGKWILRETFQDILPKEFFMQKHAGWRHMDPFGSQKRGFRLPLDMWFRNESKDFLRQSLLEAPDSFWNIFDRSSIEAFLKRYYASHIDYSDHLWALLWLSQWFAQYT